MKESRSIWRCDLPLVLASKSEGRRLALAQSGAPFEISPATVDERRLELEIRNAGGGPDDIALRLAREKALAISRLMPERLVIGADQVASCNGRIFGKPTTREKAGEQLRLLSGERHRLHSALALARGGAIRFDAVAHADLTMRALSDDFIEAYLDSMGEAAHQSVGAYQIEGLGAHLFEEISGDQWTILGLPLIPLLAALRREGVLLS